MNIRVRYKNRPIWQFFLPRSAILEASGIPIYEYSLWSGEIRNLKDGHCLRPSSRLGGRDYTLPDGSVISIRSKFTGGWTIEKNGRSEEIKETWPLPSRRQIGTNGLKFDCDAESDQIYTDSSAATIEDAIIAFHAFYQAQLGD